MQRMSTGTDHARHIIPARPENISTRIRFKSYRDPVQHSRMTFRIVHRERQFIFFQLHMEDAIAEGIVLDISRPDYSAIRTAEFENIAVFKVGTCSGFSHCACAYQHVADGYD